MRRLAALSLAGLALLSARGEVPSLQAPATLLAYDLGEEGAHVTRLDRSLREVSGLATDGEGRLFAHQDERAVIYRVDPESGNVMSRFFVGSRRGVRGDYEGLAWHAGRFYLSTSQGTVLEFPEGAPEAEVEPIVRRTHLGDRCELEGLAFDEATAALLLPCKTPDDRSLRDHVVVFRVPIATFEPEPQPWILLPVGALERVNLDDSFHPSAIEVHPRSGTLLLVAAREEALIEIDREGRLLAGRSLSRRRHPQPEGIAFAADVSLLLADEGDGGRATLARYPIRPPGGRP